jgi:rare lipoprotein A
MKSYRGLALLLTGIFLIAFTVSCAPGQSFSRRDDYSRSDKEYLDEDGYQEESTEFGDDRSYSKRGGDRSGFLTEEERGDRDEDSSYGKGRYYQTGKASWYGREFHGKTTASGEPFNMHAYTAAHRTLPFGTIVEVKNLDNGRKVRARVNDRGPYRGKRIIDLSYKAARKLGMVSHGTTQVGIKILKMGKGKNDRYRDDELEPVVDDLEKDRYDNRGGGDYAIQAGAFYSRRNAENLRSRLESLTDYEVNIVNDGDMYKVRLEGITSRREVDRLKRILFDEDIPTYLIDSRE